MRLSASGLARAERCPASASLPHTESLSPAMERGTALHAEQERESPEGAEVAYAFDVKSGQARELGRRLGRAYPQLADTEIAGTADKVEVVGETVVVTDYKSGAGFNVPGPRENIQLGFYAVCATEVEGKAEALVRLDFLDQERHVMATLDAFDLASIRARVVSIWQAATAANPRTVVGDHCTGCPAIRNCPPHLTMAIAFTEGIWPDVMPSDGLTVAKVAQGWEHLANAKRVLGLVERTYRAFASLNPIPLANGKTLGAHEVTREELDGAVTFQVLRDLHGEAVARGAVSMETSKTALGEALRAVAPNGARARLTREALQAIRDANGVNVKRGVRVEEFKEDDNVG